MDILLFQFEGKTAFLPVSHLVGNITGHTPPFDDGWVAAYLRGVPEVTAASVLDDDTCATKPMR